MATSGKRSAADRSDAASSEGGAFAGAAGLPELAQRQMVATAEAMSQLFARYEALQRAQLQVAERASLLHRQAADNLRKASSPFELAAIQGTLVMYQYQEAARFWQEWMGMVARAGAETAASASAGAGNSAASEPAPSPAAAAVGAAMSAAGPMAEAFQQMFMAPLNAANQAH